MLPHPFLILGFQIFESINTWWLLGAVCHGAPDFAFIDSERLREGRTRRGHYTSMVLPLFDIRQDRRPYHVIAKVTILLINKSVGHHNCSAQLLQVYSEVVIIILRPRKQIREAQLFRIGRTETRVGPHRSWPITPGVTVCDSSVFTITSVFGFQFRVAVTYGSPTW